MVIWLRRSSHLEKVWLVSSKREDASTATRENHGIKESEMKFEMELGFIENEKITIETWDFEKIQIIKDFITFQEEYGWAVDYEAVDLDDEDTEEEEVPVFALNAHEPL